MGEHKNNPNRPLTHEETKQKLSDLYVQYQKLVGEYQKVCAQLQAKDFDTLAFSLSMLFKVMEHTEHYSPEFVKWAAKNIEASLTSFVTSLTQEKETEKTEKNQNEAE